MKNLFRLSVFVLLGVVLLCGRSFADVPTKISFQGRLTNSSGSPITASNQQFIFYFYNSPSAASFLNKTVSGVDINNGLYSVVIEFTSTDMTHMNNNLNGELYVQVYYDGSMVGNRTLMGSSPYALNIRDSAITDAKISSTAGIAYTKLADLPASKITSGEFDGARIPNLDAGKITAGTLNAARMPDLSSIYQSALNVNQLNAVNSGITSALVTTYNGYGTTIAGKQNTLTTTQLDAVNSGITSTLVTTYNGYGTAIAGKQNQIPAGSVGDIVSYSGTAGTLNILARVTAINSGSSSHSNIPTEQAVVNYVGSVSGGASSLPAGGSNGQFLRFDSAVAASSASWNSFGDGLSVHTASVTVTNPLPTAFPALQSGQFLTNNGTNLSWAVAVDTFTVQSIENKTFNHLTVNTGGGSTGLRLENSNGGIRLFYDHMASVNSGVTNGPAVVVEGNFVIDGWAACLNGVMLNNADLAEIYPSSEILAPGEVVVISETRDGYIEKSRTANDTKVAGVISTKPGIVLNSEATGYQLALVGKVPVNVTNEGGNIKRGDLLTASSTPGYAMKAPDNPKPGTIIGKALENYTGSRGKILALVNLQ